MWLHEERGAGFLIEISEESNLIDMRNDATARSLLHLSLAYCSISDKFAPRHPSDVGTLMPSLS